VPHWAGAPRDREELSLDGAPARSAVRFAPRPSAVKRIAAQVSGPRPSNSLAEMVSSTIASVKAHLLLAPTPSQHGPGHRSLPLRAHAGGLCSAAGLQRGAWRARLARALAEDRFILHYQPIISLRDGSTSHHEALVRLADGRGGLLPPAWFLPAAERCGLIRDIDRMVLAKVAALMGGAGGERALSVAVNLSGLSVTDPGLLAYIERQLELHEVDPARLVIELTETASISDMSRARAFCSDLQALGAAVALDDFGTGFGSLHYLKRLPFRYLKIDGEFIRSLPVSPSDQLVVQALVGVVRGMGASTIAEFVSDQPTIGMLRAYGVDYAQGFAVGTPRAALALAA
jgi:EAL domain-containing protein (putative c-di-GMP-specific phosphodiesterase class I)